MKETEKYRCSMAGHGVCQFESIRGLCSNPDSCTNKQEVEDSKLIQKYKNKLLTHLYWETENDEIMNRTEKLMFDMHISLIKEVIKDLEDL